MSNSGAGDPSLLRRLNAVEVLRTLHTAAVAFAADPSPDEDSSLTVTGIAAAVGVSRPTAEGVVEDLLQQGWVEEVPPTAGRRSAGRPARRFRFLASAGFVVGIDVGWDSVRAVVADLAGRIVSDESRPVQRDTPAETRLEAIRVVADASMATVRRADSEVLATCIGTTGIVDSTGHVLIETVFPDWASQNIGEAVHEVLHSPVVVHNDIRLGAVAERWRGAAAGADDVVYLHAGVRMGSSFLVSGQFHRGAHSAAGEQTQETLRRWVKAYDRLLAEGAATDQTRAADGSASWESARTVFDAAARGEERARVAVERFVLDMLPGILPLITALDPAVLVIGGDASRAGDYFGKAVRRHLSTRCLFPPEVLVSPLGDDAVVLGAVRTALDLVEAELFADDLSQARGSSLPSAPRHR